MYRNKFQVSSSKFRVQNLVSSLGNWNLKLLLLAAFCLLASACGVRSDMQDQPRYKVYKKSEWYKDGLSTREMPEGTVARGQLKENKAFYTGKIDNPNPTAVATSTMDAAGNTVVTSFPNAVEEFPVPVTKELVDRGQDRYNIYCIVCHGPMGNGDGMIVRRGFSKPPTYNDDRLRNAPVGHYFDVISNGWGKMNGYAAQIQPADRWAIIGYIRALQVSQNPDQNLKMNNANTSNTAAPTVAATPNTNSNSRGGAR